MIRALRLIGIAIGSLVSAALVMTLIGAFIPPLLGTWTVPLGTVVLGGLIFQDIARRDAKPRAT